MNDIFKKAGAGLLILGVSFYAITQTITALIPGFLGGIILLLTLLSDRFPNQSRHFAHVILLVLLAGAGATYKSVIDIFGYLLSGDALLRPLATIEQFTAFIICLSAIIMGIQSFIEARKK